MATEGLDGEKLVSRKHCRALCFSDDLLPLSNNINTELR
jgi:hypothetical protein